MRGFKVWYLWIKLSVSSCPMQQANLCILPHPDFKFIFTSQSFKYFGKICLAWGSKALTSSLFNLPFAVLCGCGGCRVMGWRIFLCHESASAQYHADGFLGCLPDLEIQAPFYGKKTGIAVTSEDYTRQDFTNRAETCDPSQPRIP